MITNSLMSSDIIDARKILRQELTPMAKFYADKLVEPFAKLHQHIMLRMLFNLPFSTRVEMPILSLGMMVTYDTSNGYR
jgi:hypothetical protein